MLALGLLLALPVTGQSMAGRLCDGYGPTDGPPVADAGARLVTVARRARYAKAKAAQAVSRAQMELAHEMVRDAYAQGQRLEPGQRVALMTRLLYTMRPEVMAAEKKQWAEELFGLAQQLPTGVGHGAGTYLSPSEVASEQELSRELESRRNEAIATAAARAAVYDSDRALELLDTLPSQGGRREDTRTMASRLVFAIYLQHHGAAGAQTLLAHGRKWGEHGGFPYGASSAALARLREDDDAAGDFFRQGLAVFARGQEGVYGVRGFAGLLERAVAMEAISDEAAEEAGRAVVAQLSKLAGAEGAGSESAGSDASGSNAGGNGAAANTATGNDVAANDAEPAASSDAEAQPAAPLTEEETRQVMEALNDVRLSAAKAYARAAKDWPGLFAPGAGVAAGNAALPAAGAGVATPVEELKVDSGLQASFGELAEALRERRGPEEMREVIARGLQRVNARYKAGECAKCVGADAGTGAGGYAATDGLATGTGQRMALRSLTPAAPAAGAWGPDAQSWALVSLAAYAAPMTIAAQLKSIEAPFWHAYFLAIAAQQVGEPTRVADPTARRVAGKEEAEPE